MEVVKYHRSSTVWIMRLVLSSCYCVALAFALASPLLSPKRTLLFRDDATGVAVHLVGTMHYNPHSVAQTRSVVAAYGERGRLGSVVLETCAARWDRTRTLQPPGTLSRTLLDNEFQTAAETASAYGVAVVLGDEDVDDNDAKINAAFRSSVRDYSDPLGGGWTRLSHDLVDGYRDSVAAPPGACDGDYLDASDLCDPALLLCAPVSLARYALAVLVRKPVKGALLLGWLGGLVTLLVTRGFVGLDGPEQALAVAGGFLLSLSVGLLLLGRVFLVALLGERNEILARNVRAACAQLATSHDRDDPVCVAVLGLAHCNGVKRLLTSTTTEVL